MDRVMSITDSCYMHRAWLIEVDYKDPTLIASMKSPQEIYNRMDSIGALLALSAAVVRTAFTTEDEVRLLFDASIQPSLARSVTLANPELLRIPFSWDEFIDYQEDSP